MKLKRKFKILFSLLFIFLLTVILIIGYYKFSLLKVSNNSEEKIIEIKKGSSSIEIGKVLKENKLIRDKNTFVVYIKLNKIGNLNYGTYKLRENMGLKEIVKNLVDGSKYNPDEVRLTIKEGVNLRAIAKEIESVTNNTYDDVLNKANDVEYINKLVDKYWFMTDEVLNNDLIYKLEGYLYPDTYFLANKDVSVESIFDKMIDQMDKKLEKYKNNESDLTIHELLTLASMVEKESAGINDGKTIASVFLNRKKLNMNLGSDITARYANKIDDPKKVLSQSELQIKSLYNTRLSDGTMNGKLPVGPIATISKESLDAAYYPDDTEYLYFVANIKTKETFFYKTYSDFLNKKGELQEVNGGL